TRDVEPVHALGVRRKPLRRRLRAEHFERWRIKSKSGRNSLGLPRAYDNSAQDGLVAKVNPIEIADCKDAAAGLGTIVLCPIRRGTECRECPRRVAHARGQGMSR